MIVHCSLHRRGECLSETVCNYTSLFYVARPIQHLFPHNVLYDLSHCIQILFEAHVEFSGVFSVLFSQVMYANAVWLLRRI